MYLHFSEWVNISLFLALSLLYTNYKLKEIVTNLPKLSDQKIEILSYGSLYVTDAKNCVVLKFVINCIMDCKKLAVYSKAE